MKISSFFLTLAICGAGATHATAQTTRLASGHPGSPIVLASQFDDELSFSEDVPEVADGFQFERPAQPVIDVPSVSNALEAPSPSDANPSGRSVLDNGSFAPEPRSLPVATHGHGQQALAPSHNVMAGVMHVQDGSVMWNANSHSPVARVLLRTDCNAGQLWNNYPAERAAECAAMWNCLNKSHGRKCGCSQCDATECDSGGCAMPKRACLTNRYRTQRGAAGCESCDTCDGLAVVPTTGTVVRTVANAEPTPTAQPVRNPGAYTPDIRSLPRPPKSPAQTMSRPSYNTASSQYRVMR